MKKVITIILISVFVLGCGKTSKIPNGSEVSSINIKLNDPSKFTYWDFEKKLDGKHWKEIRSLFSIEKYDGKKKKWQGLAVIEIILKSGDMKKIEVYNTDDRIGCYEFDGGLFVIPNENLFYEKLSNIIKKEP